MSPCDALFDPVDVCRGHAVVGCNGGIHSRVEADRPNLVLRQFRVPVSLAPDANVAAFGDHVSHVGERRPLEKVLRVDAGAVVAGVADIVAVARLPVNAHPLKARGGDGGRLAANHQADDAVPAGVFSSGPLPTAGRRNGVSVQHLGNGLAGLSRARVEFWGFRQHG